MFVGGGCSCDSLSTTNWPAELLSKPWLLDGGQRGHEGQEETACHELGLVGTKAKHIQGLVENNGQTLLMMCFQCTRCLGKNNFRRI